MNDIDRLFRERVDHALAQMEQQEAEGTSPARVHEITHPRRVIEPWRPEARLMGRNVYDRDAWRGLHFDSDDTAPLTEGEVLAAIAGLDVPFRHELPPVDFESIQRRIANGTPDYLLWPSLVDLDVSHGTPVGLG